MKRIGIAVVEWQDAFLVGIRPPDAVLPGAAEFPGGKCLPDESPDLCAVRECLEETGIAVLPDGVLDCTTFTYSHGTVELSFIHCRPVEPAPQPASGFRWIPRSELGSLNFPEGNRGILQQLISK